MHRTGNQPERVSTRFSRERDAHRFRQLRQLICGQVLSQRGLKVDLQWLSYLKLSKKKIGLLINFHVLRLKDGIKRLAN
jgi:hypothetical protein